MDTVKVKIDSDEKASRLELIIRFIWGTICGIILGIIGIVAYAAAVIQWIHILVLGKRNTGLTNFINAYLSAMLGLQAYMYLSIEERPPIVPPL